MLKYALDVMLHMNVKIVIHTTNIPADIMTICEKQLELHRRKQTDKTNLLISLMHQTWI